MVFWCTKGSVVFGCTKGSVVFGCTKGSVVFGCTKGSVVFGCTKGSAVFGCTKFVAFGCTKGSLVFGVRVVCCRCTSFECGLLCGYWYDGGLFPCEGGLFAIMVCCDVTGGNDGLL